MNLLHLSFSGSLKPHQAPPRPPTPQERLCAFRAAYPAALANNYGWKWRDDGAAAREAERHAAALPSVQALYTARKMLGRIAAEVRGS